jgi:hypothetical protein
MDDMVRCEDVDGEDVGVDTDDIADKSTEYGDEAVDAVVDEAAVLDAAVNFPYMNLILWTIPKLLVMFWIPSETSNNIRTPYHIPYLLKMTSNLKCVTLRLVNYADMIETLI